MNDVSSLNRFHRVAAASSEFIVAKLVRPDVIFDVIRRRILLPSRSFCVGWCSSSVVTWSVTARYFALKVVTTMIEELLAYLMIVA